VPEPTASQLHYAPPPPTFRRRLRRIAFWTAIGLLLLLAASLMPSVLRQARLLRLQRACEQYSAPATQVVYDYGPPPTGQVQQHAASLPQWDAFLRMAPLAARTYGTVLFLHARQSPSGHHRLVALTIASPGPFMRPSPVQLLLNAQVIQPGKAWRAPRLVSSNVIPSPVPPPRPISLERLAHGIRFYAGQVDPADASHFTLSYTIGTQPGLIDGWLRDDDSILLEARKP
jgi:hypothetical protein